jgi:hypothetical protein
MKKLVYLLMCLSLSAAASAELYKWVDENGKVHYTDQDPALDSKKAVTKEVIEAEPANVFSSDEAKTKPVEKPEVTPEPAAGKTPAGNLAP